MSILSRSGARRMVSAGFVVSLLLAACASGAGGTLSDEEWRWCQAADQGELDAAAEALNIAPDADESLEGGRSRDDPTFARICQYAYQAQGRDLSAPDANPPAGGPPSAPLQPNASPS